MHGTVEFWWLWDHHNLSLFPLIHLINIVRWSTYPIKPWNKQPPFPYQFCRFRVPKHKIRANHSRGKIDQSNHWAPWPRSPSHRRHKNIQNPTPRESIPREFQGNHNGLLEFDFAGNRISSIWMDSFRFLVHQFLPSSHFEFPKKKVSFFFFLDFFCSILSLLSFSLEILVVTYLELLINVVLWGWTSISWCSTWRSIRRIWYTTRFSTLALLSRGSTVRNMELDRFVFLGSPFCIFY